MSSERAPPERPEAGESSDAIDAERAAAHDGLSAISTEPGDRLAGHEHGVTRMVVEAELAADGVALDNPAKPLSEAVGEELFDRLDSHEDDLVPAWTRPWEGSADE